LPQGLAGPFCPRLDVRKTERTGRLAALMAHREEAPHAQT
jgi:hypothetical protein